MGTTDTPPQEEHWLIVWVAENTLAALTIAGALLYGIVRFGLQLFYDEFGLAPEDVGLGYGETLARATGFAFFFAIVLSPLVAYALLRRIRLTRWLVVGFVALAIPVLVAVAAMAIVNADRVKQGDSVRSWFVLDFGIRGEPAEIAWIDPESAPKEHAELQDHELMLLDHSGGTVTLYDVTEERTVQIPSSTVAVSVVP